MCANRTHRFSSQVPQLRRHQPTLPIKSQAELHCCHHYQTILLRKTEKRPTAPAPLPLTTTTWPVGRGWTSCCRLSCRRCCLHAVAVRLTYSLSLLLSSSHGRSIHNASTIPTWYLAEDSLHPSIFIKITLTNVTSTMLSIPL